MKINFKEVFDMNILAFYKELNLTLAEKDGVYFVADRQEQKILYRSDDKKRCTKIFIMMMSEFIEKGPV